MRKNGLSSIVSVVLIVMITIVSVTILWIGVRGVISSNSEDISLEPFTVNLELSNVVVDDAIHVSVKRGAGKGDLNAIQFVLSDGQNSESFEVETNIEEFETQTFSISPVGLEIANLEELDVYAMYVSDSGKKSKSITSYNYNLENSGQTNFCVPNCENLECGDDGCGEVCGICGEGSLCSVGICELNNLDVISWWRFDGDAFDSVGNNDGLGNNVFLTEDGKFNQAYSFPGDSSSIIVQDSPTFDLDSPASISFWIKPNDLEEDQRIFFRDNWVEVKLKDNYLKFKWENAHSGNLEPKVELSEEGVWIHVLSTVYGNVAKLYIDGEEVDEDSDNNFELNQNNELLYFGIKEGLEKEYDGLLDEIIIFNKSLSEEEIFSLYSSNLV